ARTGKGQPYKCTRTLLGGVGSVFCRILNHSYSVWCFRVRWTMLSSKWCACVDASQPLAHCIYDTRPATCEGYDQPQRLDGIEPTRQSVPPTAIARNGLLLLLCPTHSGCRRDGSTAAVFHGMVPFPRHLKSADIIDIFSR
uniref:Uncharacterized protein n=1 Tax=Anopheles minimus TaxID=112268 RepID=A0A182VRB1_9DIPT